MFYKNVLHIKCLTISLNFPKCDILATTLAAKAWSSADIFVSGDRPRLKHSPHKEKKKTLPPPPNGKMTPKKRNNAFPPKKNPSTWRKRPP